MNPISILIIEDDADINRLLSKILTEHRYNVTSAFSGTEGELLLKHERFDCLLLDLMLPGMDGEELISRIRQQHTIPILVISAKLGTEARVNALRIGADDFIPKPFEWEEVLARVEAQLRRSQVFSAISPSATLLKWKNCVLNQETVHVAVKEEELTLTALEFRILELLMSNPKKVFTRANIFESCWGQHFFGDENTVDVHISHLRSKLAKLDANEEYIKTIRGLGFRLAE